MPFTFINPAARAAALAAALFLAGCASYRPLPLATGPSAAHDLRQLGLEARAVHLPGLEPHPIDPTQPLDMTTVAMLAVAGNPDLKLARDDAGIARAQAFAAGLLPDPQFSLTRDTPGKPGFYSAFNTGLSFDFGSLITLSARRAAAGADQSKVDLTLLWQEWQVVAQARKLFVGVSILEQSRALQQRALALTGQRLKVAQQAVDAGNATLDAVSPYVVARADAQRALDDQTRQLRQARAALDALLGLAPNVTLDLAPLAPPSAPNERAVRDALAHLATRRPDLLALAAGYQAQEEKVRAAVLAQFPSLNIGFTRARDTSLIYTSGFSLGLSLPIFNRNRGGIAVETATRQRLHDEYQNRVNAAHAEVANILADETLLQAQMTSADAAVAALERTAQAAASAYASGQMTVANYVDLQSALLAKRGERLALERTELEQRIALQALLGGDVSHTPEAVAAPTSNNKENP